MFDSVIVKMFLQFFINGLMIGMVYALIAIGVVIIFRSTKVFNFAVGDMILVGGYIAWTFFNIGIPPLLVIILTIVVGALLGLIIDRLAMRPMIGQPVLAAIMVTLATAYVLKGIVLLIYGGHPKLFSGFLPGQTFRVRGIVLTNDMLWIFGVTLFLFILFFIFYKFSKFGVDMRATAEDHQLAQTRGIRVRNIFALSWALAGVTAVVGGILLGVKLSVHLPLADVGLKAFAAVIFGGLESILGALVGGLIIGILENLVGGFIEPTLKEIFPYIILLLVLVFRPEGLFGLKRIERL